MKTEIKPIPEKVPFTEGELFEILGFVIGAAGLFLLLAGPVEFGWELLTWLKTGVWPDLTVAEGIAWLGWPEPTFSWVGVQRILDWIMASDLSGALTISGWLLFVILGISSAALQS